MFLPAALMISSFLRSTIARSRRRRSSPTSPVCEPAVGVERLGRLLGPVAVAAHHAARRARAARRRRRARARRPATAGRRCRSAPRPRGLQVPAPHVSDMPHSSASWIPIAWKNSITSRGVGAAPTLTATTSSSPSIARRPANSSPSACCDRRRELVRHRLAAPARSRTACSEASSAPSTSARASSGCAPSIVSRPALSFSQMRGTAKNHVGWTCGSNSTIRRGSGQVVIVSA